MAWDTDRAQAAAAARGRTRRARRVHRPAARAADDGQGHLRDRRAWSPRPAPRTWPSTCRRPTRSRWPGCARRARSSSARPTPRCSPATSRPTTTSTAGRTTPGTPRAPRAVRPAAPAAALAAGLTPLEFGSDIGGSIRNPSHYNGVFGLKPSWGIVPLRGHIPGPPGSLIESDVGVAGPLARSVADLRLALGVTAGPLPADAAGWRLELDPGPELNELNGLRIATVFGAGDGLPAAGRRRARQPGLVRRPHPGTRAPGWRRPRCRYRCPRGSPRGGT